MILGLDISTRCTGVALVDDDGVIQYSDSIQLHKTKDFFEKANIFEEYLKDNLYLNNIDKIYIEKTLDRFIPGMSSAKTIILLSKFNAVLAWICHKNYGITPKFVDVKTARATLGIKVPKGEKAKDIVVEHLLAAEPGFEVEYTRHGNPRPREFDRADAIVIAKAGYKLCQQEKSLES